MASNSTTPETNSSRPDPSQMMAQFTAIGRPLDPRNVTNVLIMVFIVLAAIVGGVISFSVNADNLALILNRAFFAALAVFLGWAIGREIDPDHPYSALLAAILALVAHIVYSPPIVDALTLDVIVPDVDVVALLLLLTVSRIVNRTVGPRVKPLDIIAILALTGLVASGIFAYTGQWILALVVFNAFLFDGWLRPRNLIYAFLGILPILVSTFVLYLTAGSPDLDADLGAVFTQMIGAPAPLTVWYGMGITLIAVLFLANVAAARHIRATTDLDNQPLRVRRVQAGMIVVLLGGVLTALWGGDRAILAMLPLWAALLGVFIYRLPYNMAELDRYEREV